MARITIKMRDGTKRVFDQEARQREGYPRVAYEIGFVVITDQYLGKTAIPSDDVSEITQDAPPRGF